MEAVEENLKQRILARDDKVGICFFNTVSFIIVLLYDDFCKCLLLLTQSVITCMGRSDEWKVVVESDQEKEFSRGEWCVCLG